MHRTTRDKDVTYKERRTATLVLSGLLIKSNHYKQLYIRKKEY